MGRKSIRENKSVYMLTREQNGLTREKASELIDGITPSRLEKLESGRTVVQPEDVVMMARAYKEPGLCNYYCTHECAIGKKSTPVLEEKDLPQIAIEMVNRISELYQQKELLLHIAEDGTVSEDEYAEFSGLKQMIDKLTVSAQTLQLWLEKAAATGEVDQDLISG
ncbi:MAG: helix-turn-helix domain-containing protein [Parasporobacterium sp.]|nr:helix-turn-helix domain-containing protein [Parasporobacterium sp.]